MLCKRHLPLTYLWRLHTLTGRVFGSGFLTMEALTPLYNRAAFVMIYPVPPHTRNTSILRASTSTRSQQNERRQSKLRW